MSGGLIGALAGSGLVAAIGSGLVVWAGPRDRPRERGLHRGEVATSGGIAVLAAVGTGLLWALRPGEGAALGFAAALALATAMGLLGALDDLWDFGAGAKLLIQVVAALLFATFAARIESIPLTSAYALPLGSVIGALGTALWIVVVGNAVNFMDGSNGLAAGAVAIASAAFGVAAWACGESALAITALILAAAQVGFLPWNLGGRLFQGDAGALFSSTLLAGLAVLGAGGSTRGGVPLWTAPLALLPILADVLLTLLVRARARKPLLNAHREHVYQLWLARTGRTHFAVAWRFWVLSALTGLSALAIQGRTPTGQLIAFALAAGLSAFVWMVLQRRYPADPLPLSPNASSTSS